MEQVLFTTLFIIGALFSNASHIPAWLLGGGKPSHPHWKTYAVIAVSIWLLLLILPLANTIL